MKTKQATKKANPNKKAATVTAATTGTKKTTSRAKPLPVVITGKTATEIRKQAKITGGKINDIATIYCAAGIEQAEAAYARGKELRPEPGGSIVNGIDPVTGKVESQSVLDADTTILLEQIAAKQGKPPGEVLEALLTEAFEADTIKMGDIERHAKIASARSEALATRLGLRRKDLHSIIFAAGLAAIEREMEGNGGEITVPLRFDVAGDTAGKLSPIYMDRELVELFTEFCTVADIVPGEYLEVTLRQEIDDTIGNSRVLESERRRDDGSPIFEGMLSHLYHGYQYTPAEWAGMVPKFIAIITRERAKLDPGIDPEGKEWVSESVPDETHEALTKLAEMAGLSLPDFVRDVVGRAIKEHAAMRAGDGMKSLSPEQTEGIMQEWRANGGDIGDAMARLMRLGVESKGADGIVIRLSDLAPDVQAGVAEMASREGVSKGEVMARAILPAIQPQQGGAGA
ncbi:hypothetical protein [Luteolibacter sp. Populi]|uniref:hypothetical protein n=1 Tax=Luteolibacter sp. Populi TaxID=3230487 RepID=UPI00346739FA